MKNEKKQVGIVLEELPNLEFKVELASGRIIRCYTAGKLKLKKIKVMLNDRVEVVFNPSLGGEIGRITWRL